MLKIVIPGEEHLNEKTNEIFTVGDVVLELEHSLLSLSKWESRFEKPFLGDKPKTDDETLAYVECMIVTPDFPPGVLSTLTAHDFEQINEYIQSNQTATWFSERPGARNSREVITSELIYYWMVSLNIPFECERWHLNRLLTLVRVCNEKNTPPKKMSRSEIAARNRKLNAQRRNQYGTRG